MLCTHYNKYATQRSQRTARKRQVKKFKSLDIKTVINSHEQVIHTIQQSNADVQQL
jgi:hypothetical protein